MEHPARRNEYKLNLACRPPWQRKWLPAAAAVCAFGIAVGACTRSDISSSSKPPASAALDCAGVIGIDEEPGADASTFGDVAFATAGPDGVPFEIRPWDTKLLWTKIGLWIRAGRPARISMRSLDEANALVWPNSTGAATQQLETNGCDGDRGWMAFAGGLVVEGPRCLLLEVESAGRKWDVSVPLGAPCDK